MIDRLQAGWNVWPEHGESLPAPMCSRKIAGLSHRAQGDPTDHDSDITATFSGAFHLRSAQLSLPDLQFSLPGANA